jgi:hypothetical protein
VSELTVQFLSQAIDEADSNAKDYDETAKAWEEKAAGMRTLAEQQRRIRDSLLADLKIIAPDVGKIYYSTPPPT